MQGWDWDSRIIQESLEATKPKTGPLELLNRAGANILCYNLSFHLKLHFSKRKLCACTLHASILGCWAWRHKAEETRCRAHLFCPPSSSAHWGFSGKCWSLSAKWTIQPVSICSFLCYTGSSGWIFLWDVEIGALMNDSNAKAAIVLCRSWPKKVKTSNFFSVDSQWGHGEKIKKNTELNLLLVPSKPSNSSFIERASLFLPRRTKALLQVPEGWPRTQPSQSALLFFIFVCFQSFIFSLFFNPTRLKNACFNISNEECQKKL